MKIISPFTDYYDSIAKIAFDAKTRYLRETKQLKLAPEENLIIRPLEFTSKAIPALDIHVHFFMVGFAGRIYPGAKVTFTDREKRVRALSEAGFYYDLPALEALLDHHGAREVFFYWLGSRNSESKIARAAFFNCGLPPVYAHVFAKTNTPAFVVTDEPHARGAILTLNPILRDLGFVAVKDPYQAYQDLYAFLTGVLRAPEPVTAAVSDRTMAAKRGHDGKYSFRKPPKAKKPKVTTKVRKKPKKVKK